MKPEPDPLAAGATAEITLRLPAAEMLALDRYCAAHKLTRRQVMRRAFEAYLGGQPAGPGSKPAAIARLLQRHPMRGDAWKLLGFRIATVQLYNKKADANNISINHPFGSGRPREGRDKAAALAYYAKQCDDTELDSG